MESKEKQEITSQIWCFLKHTYFILPEMVHDKFHGKNSDFVGSEFVETCDELVIGYKGCDWSACYFTTNCQRQQKI